MKLNKIHTLLAVGALAMGCSNEKPPAPPETPVVTEVIAHVDENRVPGTIENAWEETMHNQVQVPGKLDPTGTYYRPPHKTIVEIRPGRVQPVQFPNTKDEQQR